MLFKNLLTITCPFDVGQSVRPVVEFATLGWNPATQLWVKGYSDDPERMLVTDGATSKELLWENFIPYEVLSFKKGDKVKCVLPGSDVERDKIYTIKGKDEGGFWLLEEAEYNCSWWRFIRAEDG